MDSDFYMVLPSNTSSSSNTTSHFRVQLPHSIDLPGEWMVALVEIQYPYSYDNLPGSSVSTVLLKHKSAPDMKSRVTPIRIPRGHYSDVQALLAVIARAVHGTTFEIVEKDKSRKLQRFSDYVSFGYDELQKRVVISLHDRALVSSVYLGPQLEYMLGYTMANSLTTQKEQRNVAKYPPDLTGGRDSIYVYADMVQHQIVGDVMAQLLRQVPIRVANIPYGQPVTEIYIHPHYLSCIKKRIDSVEIYLNDDTGNPIAFNFGKSVLKLHFKKRSHRLLQ